MNTRLDKALLFLVILLQPEFWARDAAAEDYIGCLREAVVQSRTNLPTLTQSAERAAREFLSGGNLWVAGRQTDFIAEACQRAGGLMAIAPLADHIPARHDVILYAAPGALGGSDKKLIENWQGEGATVVTFCSSAGLYRDKNPLDTLENVVALWTWTGEFVAACTRAGRMPVVYQSYGLPGGYERAKKYQGKRWHEDLTVMPIAAGVLGNEYVTQLDHMLGRIQETEMPKINRAADWWGHAKSATTMVTGHMFPVHGQDPRTSPICDFVRVPAREDKELLGANPSGFVFYLGYQFAPQKLLAEAKTKGVKLVYSDVQPGQPAEPTENIVYVAPSWPLTDGCVSVPGYDVSILPASGVVQAAIYWTIAAKAFPNQKQ